jgi:hypothetical protein
MWSANATNNFFILQNLTTCFGPHGPSSGDNYLNDIQYVLWMYCSRMRIFETTRIECHYDSYHLKIVRRGRNM